MMATATRRMLIVDDEQKICQCLSGFFGNRGFSVATIFSGEEALEWLVDHPVDVILLDILLPGISGVEVLKRAKELYPHVRVIMVTALGQEELEASARAHGAAAFVTKPFNLTESVWAAALK